MTKKSVFLAACGIIWLAVVGLTTANQCDVFRKRLQEQTNVEDANKDSTYAKDMKEFLGRPRDSYEQVTDCIYVTSSKGPFTYVATSNEESTCGMYFMTDPDRLVEIYFMNFDVPCERNGLVSIVNGWELNGEVFPSNEDARFPGFCGRNVKRTFLSTHNAALIQYRVPIRGKGFSVYVRYPRNHTPCNVLSTSLMEPFTLRNYGRRGNCTLAAVFPAKVELIAHSIGMNNLYCPAYTSETGSLRKCEQGEFRDVIEIGGSHGLDTGKSDVLETVCGMNSRPGPPIPIEYGVTWVRLISSGYYDNSVTLTVTPLQTDLLEVIGNS